MTSNKFKKIISSVGPCMERLAVDVARGYAFGCVFGMFTPTGRPLTTAMHRSGKDFAKMSAVYSLTEISLECIRKKNDFINSTVAGMVSGGFGARKGMVPTSLMFGAYSGVSSYLQKLNDKNTK